ncbi:hypothetical protein KAR91_78980 [Candidatus Pacearchaeota archaeon]|nr:hypothetical protein [Candidatus Pacearchaeota archaeon]
MIRRKFLKNMGLLSLFPSLSPLLKLIPNTPSFTFDGVITGLRYYPYELTFKEACSMTLAFSFDASKGSESSRMYIDGIKYKLDKNDNWVKIPEPEGNDIVKIA